MTKDTNTTSGATEPDNVTRQPAWSLGYIDGNWRDIDHQDHDGVMRIVWKMEGEERTPECEALAHAVIAALNGVADHDGLAGQILRSGGTSAWPAKYFARAAQVADRAIESCPELNMSNYDEVDVDRLNDWAIRAYDEIRRLHTESEMRRAALLDEMQKAALAAGQATAAQQGVAYAAQPDEREAFESWLRSVWTAGYGCPKCDSGKYVHGEAQRFWECWQARASHGQAPAGATLPDGWVPLTITHEGQYPEEVAYGPQIMMDRLGKWLGKYFAQAAQADSVQEDAALWHWLAEYLVGTRTDLDDEIVASETVNDLRKLVKAAIKQGEKQ